MVGKEELHPFFVKRNEYIGAASLSLKNINIQ
jgi:hypothetical protein